MSLPSISTRIARADVGPTLASLTAEDTDGCVRPQWLGDGTSTITAADVVVLSQQPELGLCALLIRRARPPFDGVWALPGGKQDAGETLEQAGAREMQEEVGLRADAALMRFALGEPVDSLTWDPRYAGAHVGATLYVFAPDAVFQAGDDAAHAQWVPVADLAAGRAVLAFEHATWLERAFGPGSPVADARTTAAFRLLAAAARERSRDLIREVNAARDSAGAQRIPVTAAGRARDRALLSSVSRVGASWPSTRDAPAGAGDVVQWRSF